MESKVNRKGNWFTNLFKTIVPLSEKKLLTAECAWYETTYGAGSYRPLEERIAEKQKHITRIIRSKFPTRIDGHTVTSFGNTCHCVVSIEEDLVEHKETLFKPFVDGGFKVINLSAKVEELEDENVFLISWSKSYKK